MSGQLIDGAANAATIAGVDDVYIVIQPPNSAQLQTAQTNIAAFVGTATWGPTNQSVIIGSPADLASNFGNPTLATYDMPTDVWVALQLGCNNIRAVRVTDGTDTAGILKLADATGFATDTLTVAGTFAAGVPLSATFTPVSGSPVVINYTTQLGDTNIAGIAASFTNAINASSAVTGPNAFMSAATVVGAVITCHALVAGTAQNAIGLTATGTGVTLTAGGATFSTGAAAGVIATLTGKFTGSRINPATALMTPGSASTATSPTERLALTFPNGVFEVYDNIVAYATAGAGYSAPALIANVVNAINGTPALSQLRPASAIFTAVAGTSSSAPLLNIVQPVTTNGTDGSTFAGGASAATFAQLGSDTAQPKTGMYALAGQIGGGKFCLSGNVDLANASAAPTALASRENAYWFGSFPTGTSSATAIANKATYGIQSYRAQVMKDFCEFTDSINNVTGRRLSPCAFAIARTCTTPPNTSPANQQIPIITGTERYSGQSGVAQNPYSPTELGQLEANGINLIVNGVPAGQFFAIRHNKNSFSASPPQNNIAYTTMTQFIAQSLNSTLFGQFVGQAQSRNPNDPVRAKARALGNDFFQRLSDAELIDTNNFYVQCDLLNNTQAMIAAGGLRIDAQVVYMGIIDRMVISVTGGQTVNIVNNPAAVTASS